MKLASPIEQIYSWRDEELWNRREDEIAAVRRLL
jgi:hypothetical protein